MAWITYGFLWCLYKLFGLSLSRHPFTAMVPLLSKWCIVTFLQICSNEETNLSTALPWEWVNFQQTFILEWTIPLIIRWDILRIFQPVAYLVFYTHLCYVIKHYIFWALVVINVVMFQSSWYSHLHELWLWEVFWSLIYPLLQCAATDERKTGLKEMRNAFLSLPWELSSGSCCILCQTNLH